MNTSWALGRRIFPNAVLKKPQSVDTRWIRLRKAYGATRLKPGMQRPSACGSKINLKLICSRFHLAVVSILGDQLLPE
jgi:hypothetical protein